MRLKELKYNMGADADCRWEKCVIASFFYRKVIDEVISWVVSVKGG